MKRGAAMHMFVAEQPEQDVQRALQWLSRLPDVVRVAVMPDVHLAGDFCIGVALATTGTIYPDAVGGDIGCGMATARLDLTADTVRDPVLAAELLGEFHRRVPILHHDSASSASGLPGELPEMPMPACVKARDARVQFGTLGRGNHFLELQSDGQDQLWLAVHSGSRAAGQAIRHHYRESASAVRRRQGLDIDSEAGRSYVAATEWARRYASLSRRRMLKVAAQALSGLLDRQLELLEFIDCDHNHVRRETHGGQELWVHRKGAISANPAEPGIIPGSMASSTYHVTGRGLAESLRSSSHGAGRCLARGEARRRITLAAFEQQVCGVHFDRRLSRKLVDEAPAAYKDITKVMRAQRKLTRIERRLDPILSYKGV